MGQPEEFKGKIREKGSRGSLCESERESVKFSGIEMCKLSFKDFMRQCALKYDHGKDCNNR